MNRPHPLDQLVKDDSLFFLEAMIPFVDYAYKKPLVLLIKYYEIKSLMQCLDNHTYISECGFDCHPKSQDELMECLCRFLPGDLANNFKNMQQMMKMMQVMQTMNETQGNSQDCESPKPSTFEEIARNLGANQSHDNPHTNSNNSHKKNLYDSVISILDEE